MSGLAALFSDYTFQVVALGSALLGLMSGVLGCFTVLQKQSLLGDGVSHSALPGVVAAFMLTGTRNTETLLLGAFVTGIIAVFSIMGIVRNSRVKFDAALALVLSVFFGLGTVLLTYVQKTPNASQAGLKNFIFGQAASMLARDVIIMGILAVVIITVILLFWKELKLTAFDADYAAIMGFSPRRVSSLLSLLLVMGIVVGLQMVGVILMSSLLIAPAVAARQWTSRLGSMAALSSVFGVIAGVAGTATSSLMSRMPTGPVIIIYMSGIVVFSILFAPSRGVISRMVHRHALRRSEKEAKEASRVVSA